MILQPIEPTGIVAAEDHREGDLPDRIERNAILLHSGPEGAQTTLYSSDGPIYIDADRIRAIVEINNLHVAMLNADYGGFEQTPLGAYPPLLDLHEAGSMSDVIGRLATRFWLEIRDVPKVGKNVACVMGKTTWLGEENVRAVRLQKIYHLSVGIDDDEDSPTYNLLGETSAVIEPAAPGAMLLKKGKKSLQKSKGEPVMAKKKTVAAPKKKLSNAKLFAAIKGEMKTLAAGVVDVNKKITATRELSKLTQRQGSVRNHLSRLMAEKKLAPSEFKKMDVKRLAALPKEALDVVLETLGQRENIIEAGQRGSTGAVPFADLGKNLEASQKKNLKTSVRASLIAKGAKLSKSAMAEHEAALKGESAAAPAATEKKAGRKVLSFGSEETKTKAEVEKEIEQKDLNEQAEEEVQEEVAEVSEDIQAQVDQLNTQVARIASLVDQIVDNDEDEIADDHEEAEGPSVDDEAELSAEDDDKEKELSEDDEDEDKKKKKELSEKAEGDDDKKEKKN